jgi:hypothetical protein
MAKESKAIVRMRSSGAASNEMLDDAITVSAADRGVIIDLAKLNPPDKVYDADYAWLRHKPGRVSLFFGKANLDDVTRLRTRVELRYSPEAFVRNFWKNSGDFRAAVIESANHWPADSERLGLEPEKMHSEKDHSEWANFEYMARVGSEATLDFYYLPTSGLAKYATGHGSRGLKIVAAMRVQLTMQELARLFVSCESVVGEIEKSLPEEERRKLAEARETDEPEQDDDNS